MTLQALYQWVDEQAAASGSRCAISGRCCRFDRDSRVRLMVTPMEVAAVRARGQGPGAKAGGGCPFQVGGLCSIRDERPLGCRIYTCQSDGQAWQPALYAAALAKLEALHQAAGIPFTLTEWRQALEAA